MPEGPLRVKGSPHPPYATIYLVSILRSASWGIGVTSPSICHHISGQHPEVCCGEVSIEEAGTVVEERGKIKEGLGTSGVRRNDICKRNVGK